MMILDGDGTLFKSLGEEIDELKQRLSEAEMVVLKAYNSHPLLPCGDIDEINEYVNKYKLTGDKS